MFRHAHYPRKAFARINVGCWDQPILAASPRALSFSSAPLRRLTKLKQQLYETCKGTSTCCSAPTHTHTRKALGSSSSWFVGLIRLVFVHRHVTCCSFAGLHCRSTHTEEWIRDSRICDSWHSWRTTTRLQHSTSGTRLHFRLFGHPLSSNCSLAAVSRQFIGRFSAVFWTSSQHKSNKNKTKQNVRSLIKN